MRVLALCTWSPHPPDNGSKIRAHYLLRALAKRHEVEAIAFCPDGHTERWPDPLPGLEGVRLHPIEEDPFRYVHAPRIMKYLSPIPLALWPSRRMQRAVRELMRGAAYDLIVAIEPPAATYAFGASPAALVLDVGNSLSFQGRERYLSSNRGTLRTYLSWQKSMAAERRLFRCFDACTLCSANELPYIRQLVRETDCHVSLIPNGVDCRHHLPGTERGRAKRLIYTGSLTYSANYDAMHYFLTEIYPLVRKDEPGLSLVITGSTKGVRLAGLGLDDSVYLTGYVDDIRPWVQGSLACVVPLREGGGTRIKILEAMALGTPVIATTKGAEGLEIEPEEHFLIADDPIGFARETVRLIRDEKLWRRMVTQARCLVEQRYDWGGIGQRFVDLVEATVERHKRRGDAG